jgi:hypothetical protein
MLIRTQDKRMLIPINNLVIALNYGNLKEVVAYSPNSDNENNYYNLGTYESEDRALEVLDDIEKTLKNSFYGGLIESTELINYNSGIYTMPNS